MDLLVLDMERLLMTENDTNKSYGYGSSVFGENKNGVIVVIGADHGGGKSRYLVRTNLLSSRERRLHNNKNDYGTRILQFCEVECKKDVYSIQAKIAPVINEAKRGMKESKLIAVNG